jgi:hypothetical protein
LIVDLIKDHPVFQSKFRKQAPVWSISCWRFCAFWGRKGTVWATERAALCSV